MSVRRTRMPKGDTGAAGAAGEVVFSGARVYDTTGQNISSSSESPLTFNSERYDTDSYHSTSVNTERFTIPVDGYYHIGFAYGFDATRLYGRVLAALRVDGSTQIARSDINTGTTSTPANILVTDYYLDAGSYVEACLYQAEGSSEPIGTTQAYSCEFWIHRLGTV